MSRTPNSGVRDNQRYKNGTLRKLASPTTLETPSPLKIIVDSHLIAHQGTLTMSQPNPTNLPARYQIRTLTPIHAQWAAAIVCHSNTFHSTVFPLVYPEAKTARFNAMMRNAAYLVDHQIESGLSLGVFDTEYKYRRPEESAAAEGHFYWDPENDDVSGDELLEAMDFPLVSVALSYDGYNALDMSRMGGLVACLPVFGTVYHHLDELDQRPPETWKAKEPCEVLMRNATSTRHDYEGKGLMGALARYLMRDAAARGFKASNIECLNDAVTHVWSKPPAPFKGEVTASFKSNEYEEVDPGGNKVNPFHPSKQLVTRVHTTFK